MKAHSTAYQKFIHEAPRKLRLVADAIRGQKVDAALDQLKFSPTRAAKTMQKILTQAKANAVSVYNIPATLLSVTDIVVEEGPRIKRWNPVSRGMAHSIIKRTSHVKLTVGGEMGEPKKVETKKTEPVKKPAVKKTVAKKSLKKEGK